MSADGAKNCGPPQLDGYEMTLIHHALDEPYPDPAARDLVTGRWLPEDDYPTEGPTPTG